MVDSLYYSSRKISERCENSFLDYRINYQKLCYLMRQITKDLNWPSDQFCKLPHTYTKLHILRIYYVLRTYYVQNEWSHSLLLNSVQARQKCITPKIKLILFSSVIMDITAMRMYLSVYALLAFSKPNFIEKVKW